MTDSKNKYCCAGKTNLYEMCAYCYNSFFADPDAFVPQDEYDSYHDAGIFTPPVCECGSDAAGGTTHSHWCPKSPS